MDRPRCDHCRNPIKERHPLVCDGDRSFHEDCWQASQPAVIAARADRQRDYERRIASEGLAALLSPYVKELPVQRSSAASVPA